MNRRDFLRTSSAAAVFAALPFISAHKALATLDPVREGTQVLPAANDVQLGGIFGKMYESGLRRLTENPLNANFVLADVNFNRNAGSPISAATFPAGFWRSAPARKTANAPTATRCPARNFSRRSLTAS